jgi:hypothetical protein
MYAALPRLSQWVGTTAGLGGLENTKSLGPAGFRTSDRPGGSLVTAL